MKLSRLIQKWTGICETSKIIIITDKVQQEIAETIKEEKDYEVQILFFEDEEEFFRKLRVLWSNDLVLVMLSIDSYMQGANKHFTAFQKPEWLVAKYAFVRLDINKESLTQGLMTEKKHVYEKIDEMNQFTSDKLVTVTSKSGTHISFKLNPFTTCTHEITTDSEMAFLPPSETSSDVVSETANGQIVIDMTVGQLYYFGKQLAYFGLVDEPVILKVEQGFIVDISGDHMAAELKEKLFLLPLECRKIVELGQGLSKMEPTGLIGVDESIIDSCHFGFGDGWKCGVHLDVVIKNPTITQASI